MSPALSLLLSLASCTLLQGMLVPPRDVRLGAQNFHVRLQWELAPGSPSNVTYEVEWRCKTSHWTKADACGGNSTSSSWACELYFDDIHSMYWARVRAVAGGEMSKWAISNELQPYRDTIVGPPKLSLLLQSDILNINITTPLTPYRRRNGSYKPVDQVLLRLRYCLELYEGDVLLQEVPCERHRDGAPCTFRFLKPSTRYCVRTAAKDVARERSQEVEQCMVTPVSPSGFRWVLLAVMSGIFLLLSVSGLCFVQLHIFPGPSEKHLPKTLQALLNRELSVPVGAPTLELEVDTLALLLPTVLPSCALPADEQTTSTAQLHGGLSQDMSGYCANGFGPVCHEGRDPSCTHSQLGHALGSQVSSRLEEDGKEHDGDDVLEQPVLMEWVRKSYTGDRDYRTSEMWLSLQLQLYSKYHPDLGAGSCLPMPTLGRSFSQEDLRQSLGMAGHCVPLSSVKLPPSKTEDRGQLVCVLQPLHGHGTEPQLSDSSVQLNDLEQGAPGIPSQPPRLPLGDLQADAFSGYKPRPSAAGEL